LMLVGRSERPQLLHGQAVAGPGLAQAYRQGKVNAPALLQAQVVDVDLDGLGEIVGLSEDRKPTLLRNRAGQLSVAAEAFGRDADWPADLMAVRALDCTADGFPDLLLWSPQG